MEIALKDLFNTQFKTKNFIVTTDSDGNIDIVRNTVFNNETMRGIWALENITDRQQMTDSLASPLFNAISIYKVSDDNKQFDEELYYTIHRLLQYFAMENDVENLITTLSAFANQCHQSNNVELFKKVLDIIKEKYDEWVVEDPMKGKLPSVKNEIKKFLENNENNN